MASTRSRAGAKGLLRLCASYAGAPKPLAARGTMRARPWPRIGERLDLVAAASPVPGRGSGLGQHRQ
ncbi:hypothetical protein [Glutamicibacter sp. TV12E]|uniref:hypothetical protein n=1 Tax=Glutamicibacter sp. TV12E TaxID=3446362 RepID=UPI00403340D9